jgi:hypothetical protein
LNTILLLGISILCAAPYIYYYYKSAFSLEDKIKVLNASTLYDHGSMTIKATYL